MTKSLEPTIAPSLDCIRALPMAKAQQLLATAPHPYVWCEGIMATLEETFVPPTTHALHYGTSVFEGIRAYRDDAGTLRIWALDQHVARMMRSSQVGRIKNRFKQDPGVLRQAILDTVALNDDGQVDGLYVRPVLMYGVNPQTGYGLGVDPTEVESWLMIMVVPWGKYVQGGTVVAIRRDRPTVNEIDGTAKLACFYGGWSVPAKVDARAAGGHEAVFVGARRSPSDPGRLYDGSGQEVFVVRQDGQLLAIRTGALNILPSITKWFLFEEVSVSHRQEFPREFVDELPLDQVSNWVGMGLLGTASEVAPVTTIRYVQDDGSHRDVIIGDGQAHPKVLALGHFLKKVVHNQYPEYEYLLPAASPVSGTVSHYRKTGTLSKGARLRLGL